MEILAPAGSKEQGIEAINAGCNAIYGGLKVGNARVRAKNFTINEYEEMLDYCHRKNVLFYMTINTLMHTSEIDYIIETLNNITLPDAVIVADIGLLLSINKHFPTLPIHVSTQFGARNIEDVKYLKNIGASRVVLARELSLEEIKNIVKNVEIEVEVFISGSQCVMYSGLCLMGGLIHNCSGNRGRCIGMCRDLYESKGQIGQFMYPKDLRAINLVKSLEDIGVNSIKIEGRLRKNNEIKEIIEDIRKEKKSNSYGGYLEGSNRKEQMFKVVNDRVQKKDLLYNIEYTKDDLMVIDDKYIFGCNDKNSKYVKTMVNKPFVADINISIKLIEENSNIIALELISTDAQRCTFRFDSDIETSVKIYDIYKIFRENLVSNMYEFISELPMNAEVRLNISQLMGFIEEINDLCIIKKEDYNYGFHRVFIDKNSIIQSNRLKDLLNAYEAGYKSLVYDISNIKELSKCIGILGNNVIYRLPVLDFNNNNILPLLKNRKVMLSHICQVGCLEDNLFEEVYIDYTCNIWNEYAIDYLSEKGVKGITISVECKYTEIEEICKRYGIESQIIKIGKIPLGYTRACFKETGLCGTNCKEILQMKNIEKGFNISIYCNHNMEVRTIYREHIDVFLYDSMSRKRVILSNMDRDCIEQIINKGYCDVNAYNTLYERNVI